MASRNDIGVEFGEPTPKIFAIPSSPVDFAGFNCRIALFTSSKMNGFEKRSQVRVDNFSSRNLHLILIVVDLSDMILEVVFIIRGNRGSGHRSIVDFEVEIEVLVLY